MLMHHFQSAFLGIDVCFFLTLPSLTAPRADAQTRGPTAIVSQNRVLAEAEVAIVIAGEKNDEVEVTTATVHEDEAKNGEVTNEDATTAGTETKEESEVGARTDEAETRTEKGGAEVAIETERGDEVLIVKNRVEEITGKRKEAERKTGHAAVERENKTINTAQAALQFQMYRA